MFYAPIVIETDREQVTVCSIECARHHGYEPERMALASEYNDVCYFCGYDPEMDTYDEE